MAAAVLLFAFDPVDELDGHEGLLTAEAPLAELLIAEHRAERIEDHATVSMRYVRGSDAHAAARDALRAARAEQLAAGDAPPAPRRGRPPRER